MTIAATRMHRSLVDFASGSTDMYGTLAHFHSPIHCRQCSLSSLSAKVVQQHGNLPGPKTRRIRAASISPDQMGVAVHVVSEQHISQQMSSNDSCIDIYERVKREPEPIKTV